VKAVYNSLAEFGFSTACEELVKFDEETGVWVGSFDDPGRGFVASTASSCF